MSHGCEPGRSRVTVVSRGDGRYLGCRDMSEVTGTSTRQRWTLLLVCTAAFMLLLDITVVGVALPSIQRDLHASLPDLQWVSAAYALVLAVLLLPAATLGDRLGRRRLFLVGLVIFTIGSLACALAASAVQLELFRALQGVGGAVLFATATPLLRAEFSGAALARALGAFGATLGGASAIGPLVGGVLTDTLGWRAIFFVNLPIGVAAFVAGVARLRESRNPAGGRADWVGTGLIIAALTALMFALIRGNGLGWRKPGQSCRCSRQQPSRLPASCSTNCGSPLLRWPTSAFSAAAASPQPGSWRSPDLGDRYRDDHLSVAISAEHPRLLPGPGRVASAADASWPPSRVAFLTGRLIGKVAMRVLLGVAMSAAAVGARLDGSPDRHVQLAGAVAWSRPGRDRLGHHFHRPGLGSTVGGRARPRRDGRRPDQHAAPGRHCHRRSGVRRPVRLPRERRHPPPPSARAHCDRHQLTGWPPPSPPAPAPELASTISPAARTAVTHAAHAGVASGLNDVLLSCGCIRRDRGDSRFRVRTRPSKTTAAQPRSTIGPAGTRPTRDSRDRPGSEKTA